MSANQTQRPKFYEEQYLGAADLTAAVEYGRIQHARHSLGAHTWGIAMGLQLIEKDSAGGGGAVDLFMQPGYAWDGFGRPIVALAPYKIAPSLFANLLFDAASPDGYLVKVWLRYYEQPTRPPKPGFASCGSEGLTSRFDETFRVEAGERPGVGDRRDQITVAGRQMDAGQVLKVFDPQSLEIFDASVPFQVLPESGQNARWLLPLGSVLWKPDPDPTKPGSFGKRSSADIETSNRQRRYVGIIGEFIQAADKILRLRKRGDDPSKPPYSDDLVWVEGTLRVNDDLKMFGGKVDFRDKSGSDSNAPLRIQRIDDIPTAKHALQITLGDATAAPQNNRFSVGPLIDSKVPNEKIVDEKFTVLGNGNIGIGTATPGAKLEINDGDLILKAKKDDPGDLIFQDSAGVQKGRVWSNPNAGAAGLFLSSGDNTPDITIDAVGHVGVGTTSPVSKLQVAGDLALEKITAGAARALPAGATICWNDGSWLRLNQNIDLSKPIFGVHTPGLFAPESLNVGGAGSWGDPGGGNVWVKGSVGIGTTTPRAALQVAGGAIMPAVGNSPFAGIQFPSDPGGGLFDEAFIRYFPIAGETTKLLIGINNDADDTIGFHQAGAERMTIRSGLVGIGTDNPQFQLHVNGDAAKPTGFFWSVASDARLKTNVTPLTDALNRLTQLRGVRFHWKEPEKMANLTGQQMGLIAQDVQTVFPEWIGVGRDGHLTVNIRGFEALVIEAFRELQTEIERLRERVDELAATPSGPAPPGPKKKSQRRNRNERTNRKSPGRAPRGA